jgi:glutaredoxin 3
MRDTALMVLIFGKENCPYTRAARDDYAARDVAVEYIDVRASRQAMDQMLGYSDGVRRVPVIVEDGKVTIGFGGT